MTQILICRGKDYEIPVLLSDEDYEWAARLGNWFVTHGATPSPGYAVRSMGGRLIFLHKEVLRRSFVLPPSPKHIIGDHINSNRFDNTRPNLRWATAQMNARNRFGFAGSQLGFDLHAPGRLRT